jgi:hypothetical protein
MQTQFIGISYSLLGLLLLGIDKKKLAREGDFARLFGAMNSSSLRCRPPEMDQMSRRFSESNPINCRDLITQTDDICAGSRVNRTEGTLASHAALGRGRFTGILR